MGQDVTIPSGPVGQGMGRYQEGTAPQVGADPKAKQVPPGADLAGLSGMPAQDPGIGSSPSNEMLKTMIAKLLMQGGRR